MTPGAAGKAAEDAAIKLGLTMHHAEVREPDDIEKAFAAMSADAYRPFSFIDQCSFLFISPRLFRRPIDIRYRGF